MAMLGSACYSCELSLVLFVARRAVTRFYVCKWFLTCLCGRPRRLASVSRLRFRNRSLHSSIRNFLLLQDSAAMLRELGLVLGMWVEVGEELKTGKAAQGGARRVPQGGRLEKLPA